MPDDLEIGVGSLVRVPLSGRRVRGWVVAETEGSHDGLKPVARRSGDIDVFDGRLLEVLRWAAFRYVAPLSTVLSKTTPPNLPRMRAWKDRPSVSLSRTSPSADFTERLVAGRRPATEVWSGGGPWAESVAALTAPALAAGRSALVVAATGAEAGTVAAGLEELMPGHVVLSLPDDSAAVTTSRWVEAASREGSLVVGTRGSGFWPVRDLAAMVVLGDGRRGMKDKATPTTHVREVSVKRSQVQRFGLVLAGLVPTAESLAVGRARSVPTAGRTWGHVEVVDRRQEDAGGSLIGPTARAALRAAVADGARVLLFTHRRSSAQRCARCKTLRTCARCGSGAFDSGICVRCEERSSECSSCGFGRFEMLGSGASRIAAEAGRVVGRDKVGPPDAARPVVVGTERDLPGLEVSLTIVVDADGPLVAPTFRAQEDGFRLLARAVATAGRGRGRRGLLQTTNPDHPVFQALRTADPVTVVRADSKVRSAAGFPPAGELLVVEVDMPPTDAEDEIVEVVGDRAQILGPADHRGRSRWLLQGSDLTAARIAVRSLVARWREGGSRVRVDADPIDL